MALFAVRFVFLMIFAKNKLEFIQNVQIVCNFDLNVNAARLINGRLFILARGYLPFVVEWWLPRITIWLLIKLKQHNNIFLMSGIFLCNGNDNTRANSKHSKKNWRRACTRPTWFSLIPVHYEESKTTSSFILGLRLWCKAHMKSSVFVPSVHNTVSVQVCVFSKSLSHSNISIKNCEHIYISTIHETNVIICIVLPYICIHLH